MEQSFWIIIVAPISTLLAVVVERLFAELSNRRQARDAIRKEDRRVYTDLLKLELEPILEFADRASQYSQGEKEVIEMVVRDIFAGISSEKPRGKSVRSSDSLR
jgi:hypothetical protein